ncbi:MAG TPA: efflux RND transporter periplasmic adaptor subunit [Ignavibacteriaceae bacterium]|nr:efflux RND transporter periplasmic adaptor subunit [Ignavibacteriaceae bacterium]
MKKIKSYIAVFLIILISLGSLVTFDACSNEKVETGKDGAKKVYWTCTMHPQVISDKPGTCPICQMELVKKVEKVADYKTDTSMQNMLNLSSGKLALAGVEVVKVIRQNESQSIKTFSYLDFIEGSREVISARVSGRIEKLFVRNTGDYISKGSPVFEIYSPTLVEAQNDLLIALNNGETNYSLTNNSNNNNYINQNKILESSRKKLELMGFTQKQIADLENNRQIQYTTTYYAPVSGVVIEKNIQNGMYVNEGAKLFEVGDLSKLWNISDIFEKDLTNIKVGTKVKVELKSFPGETFDGTVTMIYPVVNTQTRTVQVRSEIVNKGNKLKPQMYGETTFNLSNINGLFIPEAAVLQTGKRNIVWIKTPDEMYEGREIQLGSKFNGMYQVTSGLNEGDEIVSKGAYLIDSESQLQTGTSTGHQHGQSESGTSKQNDMNMDMK